MILDLDIIKQKIQAGLDAVDVRPLMLIQLEQFPIITEPICGLDVHEYSYVLSYQDGYDCPFLPLFDEDYVTNVNRFRRAYSNYDPINHIS